MFPLGALSSLFGGGLSATSSAAADTGDTTAGQQTSFTNYSPFAVGSGASATASGTAQPSQVQTWLAVGAAAVALYVVLKKK